jgi:ABC-type sugar transport system substrate-binding protein
MMARGTGKQGSARVAGSIAAGVALVVALGGSTLAQEPEVIRTIEGVTHQGPWYVYDRDACTFVETADHPDAYVAELKAIDGTTLVYAPEGQTAEFDVTLNAGVEAAATEAGMAFFQFSNEFPDTTLPIQVADQAVTVEADVVISGNVLADLYPQIQSIYEAACIPFLNQFAVPGTENVPRFQADNYVTGAIEAEAAAAIITERGWPMEEIRIVTCTDPAVTTDPGTVYDINRGFRETLVELLGLSADQIEATDLVCTFELGAERARQSMADWLTANPDVTHVVGTTHIDDVYSLGLAIALRDAGFEDRGLVVGRGGGSAFLELIASGDPIAGVSGNPDFPSWGAPIVAMAQDIALGRPVPYLVSPPVAAVTAANVDQYLGE